MEPVTFIINPVSGRFRKNKMADWILKYLDMKKYRPEIIEWRESEDATTIASARAGSGTKIVVAVGGDGTVNEVGKALIGTDTLLGIIPCGSGNGLARHLQIPMDPGKAISVINNTNWINMDYARINNIPFFCTSGIGFDAKVGNDFASQKRRGFLTYMRIILSEYYKYKTREYLIDLNGEIIRRKAFLISFANASQYGNNAFIAPFADVEDGLLDLCIVSKFPRYKVFELGFRMIWKKLPSSPYYEVIKVREATVRTSTEEFIHYDGEPGDSFNEVHVKVFPEAIKVIVP